MANQSVHFRIHRAEIDLKMTTFWVFMGYNPQESLENTINTMGAQYTVRGTPVLVPPQKKLRHFKYGYFQKLGYSQIIHFNRIFHYFHHPFSGCPPIFGLTPICFLSVGKSVKCLRKLPTKN